MLVKRVMFVMVILARSYHSWISNSCDLGDDEIGNEVDASHYGTREESGNGSSVDHVVRVVGTRCRLGSFTWSYTSPTPLTRTHISGFKIKFLPPLMVVTNQARRKRFRILTNSNSGINPEESLKVLKRVCVKPEGESTKYDVFVIKKKIATKKEEQEEKGKGEDVKVKILELRRGGIGRNGVGTDPEGRRIRYLIPGRDGVEPKSPTCYDFEVDEESAIYVELMTWHDHTDGNKLSKRLIKFSYHVQDIPTSTGGRGILSCTGKRAILAYCSSDIVIKGYIISWQSFPDSKVGKIRYTPSYLYKPRIQLSDKSQQTINYDLIDGSDQPGPGTKEPFIIMGNVRFAGEEPYATCIMEVGAWEKLRLESASTNMTPCKL